LVDLVHAAVEAFYRDEIRAGRALLLAKLRANPQEQALSVCFREAWSGASDRGAMIIFNGAIWHDHTANVTSDPGEPHHLTPAIHLHMSFFAHYISALDKKPHWLSAGKLECRK
jgi:hypothetical protein